MTDLNEVRLIGRITKDVGSDEYSYTVVGNGTPKAVVSIAVNRSVKKGDHWEEEANFFDITVWGKPAESLKPYLKKGQQILVCCHLQQDKWEKDGKKMSKVTLVSDNIQLLGGKKDGGSNGNANTGSAPAFDPSDGFPDDCPF
jgi:single-strand DNA-binding protein